MSDEIKIRIGLEGDADIKKKLDGIRDHGQKFGADISKRINESVHTNPALGKAFGAEEGLERGRIAAERFRESIHALHPLLGAAGLEIGGLGSYARLAGAGMATLGAVITGAVVVALAKMGDEAIVAKKRLGDLLQNPAAGSKLFESLKQQAHDLKTPISNLLPSIESLIDLRNKQNDRSNERYAPGAVPSPTGALSNEKLLSAQKTLFEGLKGGGATADEATKAMADFNGELAKTGHLSADMVQNLAKASPGFANTFAQSLQRGLGNSTQLLGALEKGAKISAEDIINDLVRIGPAVHESLANAPKDAKTFSDALDGAKASASELLDVLKGPNVSIPLLETLSKILDQDKKDLEGLIGLWKKLTGILENSPLGALADKISKAFGTSKPANDRVSEGFDQLPKTPDGKPAPGAATAASAPAPGAEPTSGHIIPKFNADGSVNPYGGQRSFRTDDYSNPPYQAPSNEAERRQQQGESAAVGKEESENQKRFNQNIAAQNGGYNPTPDKDNYAPPIVGHYEPRTQHFVANRNQPVRDPNQIPGAPQPTTFPTYQRELTKEFQGKYGPSGNPPGVENPFQGSASPTGSNSPSDPEGQLEPPKRIYITPGGQRDAGDDNSVAYADGGEARLNVSPGGHLSGPGTGKSDSIKADVANGEFVVNAEDTAKNLPLLHAINSGKDVGVHFADGGVAATGNGPIGFDQNNKAIYGKLTGSADVTYDPNTGGAYINGNLYPPGSPILNDPRIKAAIDRSKADMDADDSSSGKHKSDFVGHFADGGLVGARASIASSFSDRIRAMGLSSIDVPHLAIGGMPDFHSPVLDEKSLAPANGGSALGDLSHFGTVDLATDHGNFRAIAHEDVVKSLTRAAVDAKTFSTGKKPSWVGSGS